MLGANPNPQQKTITTATHSGFYTTVAPKNRANEKETENMAFTREFVRNVAKESGVEIPKELEDALVQEHLSSRNAYAEKKVQEYQAENPVAEAPKVTDSKEYKDLKKAFDDYKADQTAKETRAAKETAVVAVLKAAGIPEKRIPSVLRVYDVDSVELDENGAAKNADSLTESAKAEWADFIPTTTTQGAPTANPPATNTKLYTREEIRKMTPAEINANFEAIKASLKGES